MTDADWLRACSGWLDFPDMKENVRERLNDIADNIEDARQERTALSSLLADALGALEQSNALLKRYLKETPLGHQPHMIAHQAEAAIERAIAIRKVIHG